MLSNKLKSRINQILDDNYYTDKQHRIPITNVDEWNNEATLRNSFDLLRDFLKEKKIKWKEFVDYVAKEYQEDFLYDNYDHNHSTMLQLMRNELDEKEYTLENEQDISDYIADHIVVGLNYNEWNKILGSNFNGGKDD